MALLLIDWCFFPRRSERARNLVGCEQSFPSGGICWAKHVHYAGGVVRCRGKAVPHRPVLSCPLLSCPIPSYHSTTITLQSKISLPLKSSQTLNLTLQTLQLLQLLLLNFDTLQFQPRPIQHLKSSHGNQKISRHRTSHSALLIYLAMRVALLGGGECLRLVWSLVWCWLLLCPERQTLRGEEAR